MKEEEVKKAIESVLKNHIVCIDKDCARKEHLQNTDIIVSEKWVSRRIIKEIKWKHDALNVEGEVNNGN